MFGQKCLLIAHTANTATYRGKGVSQLDTWK